MRKGTGIFKKIEETILVCDECGQTIELENQIYYDAQWTDGYDRYGDTYDFCSIKCMLNHSDRHELMFPPDNEDVDLSIPSKFMKIIIDRLHN